MNTPFFAVGANEMGDPLGEKIVCPQCGLEHAVKPSEPSKVVRDGVLVEDDPNPVTLQFYVCKGKHFLCGVGGVSIRRTVEPHDPKAFELDPLEKVIDAYLARVRRDTPENKDLLIGLLVDPEWDRLWGEHIAELAAQRGGGGA